MSRRIRLNNVISLRYVAPTMAQSQISRTLWDKAAVSWMAAILSQEEFDSPAPGAGGEQQTASADADIPNPVEVPPRLAGIGDLTVQVVSTAPDRALWNTLIAYENPPRGAARRARPGMSPSEFPCVWPVPS